MVNDKRMIFHNNFDEESENLMENTSRITKEKDGEDADEGFVKTDIFMADDFYSNNPYFLVVLLLLYGRTCANYRNDRIKY